jgi:putative transposase
MANLRRGGTGGTPRRSASDSREEKRCQDTQRWHAHYHNVGVGHLYQGRFKSFVIEADDHYLTVCRYVERNALRAGLVRHAEDWRWGSLWRRLHAAEGGAGLLQPGPLPLPEDWVEEVNQAQTEAELAALRKSVQRGQPFGAEHWVRKVASHLGLESTLRPRGRPRKQTQPTAQGHQAKAS